MRFLFITLALGLIGCTESSSPTPSTAQTKTDEIVHSYMQDTHYVGLAISAMKGNQVVFEKSYGFNDIYAPTPFTLNELVSLGSNAKTLTAASILLLEEKGVLQLSDSLSKHLPFPLRHSEKVTLYDMLCHSSDLPDIFGVGEFENYEWQQALSQKEFINKLNTSAHKPNSGTAYSYNNTGYFLLGMVVEHLSHQSLGDFYREHIFNQLDANNIFYLGDAYYTPELTQAFQKDGSKVSIYESPVEYRIVGGAGALAGDINSYSKIFRQINSGALLTNRSQQQMQSVCQFKDGTNITNTSGQKIGLGIEITEFNGELAYTRGGALNGYVSTVYYFPSKDLTVSIIGNTWAPLAPLLQKLFANNWHNEL